MNPRYLGTGNFHNSIQEEITNPEVTIPDGSLFDNLGEQTIPDLEEVFFIEGD